MGLFLEEIGEIWKRSVRIEWNYLRLRSGYGLRWFDPGRLSANSDGGWLLVGCYFVVVVGCYLLLKLWWFMCRWAM